eukprot:gnl/TRDRNA2_/TRDRNA2_162246_c0_seq1.p1 gnl/TRDRNA2_/TRDRNA2_162246_c0~~gnl/TRDRNA2_/TRDRNA2_162246_c0_seq1.p1  ORF type:complete len:459 (+),score=70.22 gnl/TRDRNA2_/TRDRNA2_162246_c0_seq1:58-1377(+)
MAVPVFLRGHQDLSELIAGKLQTPRDVAALLGRLRQSQTSGEEFIPCLERATKAAGIADPQKLFEAIARWALTSLAPEAGPSSFPREVTPWPKGTGNFRVSFTAAQCRGLLANAFLLNVRDVCERSKDHAGGLDFTVMFQSTSQVAEQKVACLMRYFETARELEGSEDDGREVVFERRSFEKDLEAFRSWVASQGHTQKCDGSNITLHNDGMEAPEDADAFVNFANANFGYGRFIPSCTQEEIMQMCCPEFNVGMILQGRMTDDEVVNVHRVRRFSCYSGYGQSFQYVGPWGRSSGIQTILTMDATTGRHFSDEMVLRDIRKAYLCFRGCRSVSTGRWGCGAFFGTPSHKFVQQVVAAGLAGCSLYFSTFGTPDGCDQVLEIVKNNAPSSSRLLEAVLMASRARAAGKGDFVQALQDALQISSRGECVAQEEASPICDV